jgi:quercetin dioxygenase-like cupin family protein
MLQRRLFVSCALCSIGGLVATEVAAQAPAAPAAAGVRRKILQQTDGPMPGYVTVAVEIEIDAGFLVARHTHPGIESTYAMEGGGQLQVDGQPALPVQPGVAFQVPTATPHSFRNGDKPTKLSATFVVEKGKPLASPA